MPSPKRKVSLPSPPPSRGMGMAMEVTQGNRTHFSCRVLRGPWNLRRWLTGNLHLHVFCYPSTWPLSLLAFLSCLSALLHPIGGSSRRKGNGGAEAPSFPRAETSLQGPASLSFCFHFIYFIRKQTIYLFVVAWHCTNPVLGMQEVFVE